MTINELMQKIRLPEAARELALRHIPVILNPWRELLYTNTKALTDQLTPETAPGILIALAADSYSYWEEKGISEQVYIDSMYDITLWCEDYYTKHGEYGLSECGWICKSIKMELFRLGRLQFEPITLDSSIAVNETEIPEGTAVYSVHIPAGEPLDIAACEHSFAVAPSFFGVDSPIYVCGSWLLAPELADVLSSSSNILAFQKFFTIVRTFPSRQAEERIFGCVLDDISAYPEYTSLQRNTKAYLLSGKSIGGGYGVRL